jgi:hypothetical protein
MGTARRLLLFIAVMMLSAGHAGAQTMPWPGEAPPQGGQAWPGERGSPGPGMSPMMGAPRPPMGGGGMGGGGGAPPCMAEFAKLRGEVEKRGMAARAASQRKASREEMCKYVTTIVEAQAKWVKYAEANVQACGIPVQIVSQLKEGVANTEQTKQKLCAAGPAGGGAPSLHDALEPSRLTTPETAKTGNGTLDTLTGSAIRQ